MTQPKKHNPINADYAQQACYSDSAMGSITDEPWFDSFLFQNVPPGFGVHPAVSAYDGLYTWGNQQGIEANYTTPPTPEVTNTSTAPYTFMACTGTSLFSLTERSGM
jgi:hypothetical protein